MNMEKKKRQQFRDCNMHQYRRNWRYNHLLNQYWWNSYLRCILEVVVWFHEIPMFLDNVVYSSWFKNNNQNEVIFHLAPVRLLHQTWNMYHLRCHPYVWKCHNSNYLINYLYGVSQLWDWSYSVQNFVLTFKGVNYFWQKISR